MKLTKKSEGDKNYSLIKQIESYEQDTDKINSDIINNESLLKSQTNITKLLKKVNIGIFIFVIISLIYINFKSLFKAKSKISKKKESSLYNLKDDRKLNEDINNDKIIL